MTSKDFVQLMDSETLFVHLFCQKLAAFTKDVRNMSNFYVFTDKRSRPVAENFDYDAKRFAEHQRMLRP